MTAPVENRDRPLSVSRFEASLVRMVRAFAPRTPGEAPPPLPAGKLTPPKQVSTACIHLVKDALSKGSVVYLARAGGWRRERHLRHGEAAFGRLWERIPAEELGLSFSQHSLQLLVWLASGRPDQLSWDPPAAALTSGDQLLLFLVYDALREQEIAPALRSRPSFRQHGLIRLLFPDDFDRGFADALIDFDLWTEGVGASIFEALQPRFTQRLLAIERHKQDIGDWERMRDLGAAQDRALSAFFESAERMKRPDLARFFLRAMQDLLSPDVTPAFWTAGLQGSGPVRLAERLDVQRQALAAIRHVDRLARWTHRARHTGYLDEDYAVAQLWLSDWEQCRGDEAVRIAQHLIQQLTPLRIQAPAANDVETPTSDAPTPH